MEYVMPSIMTRVATRDFVVATRKPRQGNWRIFIVNTVTTKIRDPKAAIDEASANPTCPKCAENGHTYRRLV